MSDIDDAVALAQKNMDLVDTATTACGTAADAVKTRIQAKLQGVASAQTLEAAKSLAAEASTEADKLNTIVTSLNAIGSDSTNPVPVVPPVVNPDPNAP